MDMHNTGGNKKSTSNLGGEICQKGTALNTGTITEG